MDVTDGEVEATARAAVNLFSRWGLTDEQACCILGGLPLRVWANWKAGEFGHIERDLKDRLSSLVRIYKTLLIVFVGDARAYRSVSAPNDAFQGRSALDVMEQGRIGDIALVRAHLQSLERVLP